MKLWLPYCFLDGDDLRIVSEVILSVVLGGCEAVKTSMWPMGWCADLYQVNIRTRNEACSLED